MFDCFNFGFSRGEAKDPRITPALALATADALVTISLKTAYIRAMWQLSQQSAKHGRPQMLESVLAYLADIRDMGHTPAVVNALIATESMLRRLDSLLPSVHTADLLAISTARVESVRACARRSA